MSFCVMLADASISRPMRAQWTTCCEALRLDVTGELGGGVQVIVDACGRRRGHWTLRIYRLIG
jgi:hypothetical protein